MVLKIRSGEPQGVLRGPKGVCLHHQKYLDNNIKILFVFFTLIFLSSGQWSFLRL